MKPMMMGLMMLVAASIASAAYYSGTAYSCGFEQGEQGAAFVTGALTGQGTPAWAGNYRDAYDAGGSVTNAEAYAGSQSAVIGGYQTSRVTLDDNSFVPWFEFAYKPVFGSDPDALVWSRTTRGEYWDVVGIDMKLMNNATQDIVVNGVVVGHFTNNAWQSISFEHTVLDYIWDYDKVFTGEFKVYVDGVYATTFNVGSTYHSIKTMVFSAAEVSWVHGGTWYVDNINLSDTTAFVPEPVTMMMLIGGGLLTLRRRK